MQTLPTSSTVVATDLNALIDALPAKKRYRYQKDDYVFLTQQPQHLYLLCRGRIKVGSYLPNGKAVINDLLGEGDLFGEIAAPSSYQANSFAQVAVDDTEVVIFSWEELPELPEALRHYLFQTMNRRILRLAHQLESVAGRAVPYRVIDLLCRLAREQGKKVGVETMIRHGITHSDIAMLIGTSRQTVSGILAKLREKNIINYNRHRILIRNLSQLEEINQSERLAI